MEKKKKIEENRYGYSVERDIKYERIENKIENLFQLPFYIPKIIGKSIKDLIKSKFKINFTKNKKVIYWNIGFIIILSIWVNSTDPFNDFMLLTKGIEVDGVITKSNQTSEVVEINDGRSKREEFKFSYTYDYTTKDRNTFTNTEEVNGKEPEEFFNLNEEPLNIKVKYLESNPKYSRVLNYTTNNKNLYEWFRYSFFYLFISILIWTYLIYKINTD
jgi:hypothetical protein